MSSKAVTFLTSCLATVAAVLFLLLRSTEILDASDSFVNKGVTALLVLAVGSLFVQPPKTNTYLLRRVLLIFLACVQLKYNIDSSLKQSINFKNLQDHIAIVTGGNSGTGLAVAKHLVASNCKVILTCRSVERCQKAVNEIQALHPNKTELVIPMLLDLNDLASVKNFSIAYQERFDRLDFLVNNAGLVSNPGKQTEQGLEESFGSMHLGHFALTKWLLPLIMRPIPKNEFGIDTARVVNVASEAFLAGNFHPTFFDATGKGDLQNEVTDNCPSIPGTMDLVSCCPLLNCPNTNGYARAKLSNILFSITLQRKIDDYALNLVEKQDIPSDRGSLNQVRRVVTASLHPGTVSTNISPLLALTAGVTRSADDAGLVLLHAIIDNKYTPSAFINSMLGSHDFSGYRNSGSFARHMKAFPSTKQLPVARVSKMRLQIQQSGWSQYFWDEWVQLIRPFQPSDFPELQGKNNTELSVMIGERLWDLSEQMVEDWEAERTMLSTPVTVSKSLSFPVPPPLPPVADDEEELMTPVSHAS